MVRGDPAPDGELAGAEPAGARAVLPEPGLPEPALPEPALPESAVPKPAAAPDVALEDQVPVLAWMADVAFPGFPLGNAAMLFRGAEGSLAAKATVIGWLGTMRCRQARCPVSRMPPSFSSKQRGDAGRALSRFLRSRGLDP